MMKDVSNVVMTNRFSECRQERAAFKGSRWHGTRMHTGPPYVTRPIQDDVRNMMRHGGGEWAAAMV